MQGFLYEICQCDVKLSPHSGHDRTVTLPGNFGRAFDLSSLGKPPAPVPNVAFGSEVNAGNLKTDFLEKSKTKPVILLCWSARSPESLAVLEIMGALETADQGRWILGSVNADVETQVAQALQARAVPYAVAMIAEQIVPLFEQAYPAEQIRMVIDKVLSLAGEQGVGEVVPEKMEPEEEEALTAIETGDFVTAESAYKKLLARLPQHPFAKLGLAQTQLMIRTAGLNFADVLALAGSEPNNLTIQIQCADLEIAQGDVDSAFNRLLRCIRTFEGPEQAKAKSQLLELFALVDPADPRLVKARSALASALF